MPSSSHKTVAITKRNSSKSVGISQSASSPELLVSIPAFLSRRSPPFHRLAYYKTLDPGISIHEALIFRGSGVCLLHSKPLSYPSPRFCPQFLAEFCPVPVHLQPLETRPAVRSSSTNNRHFLPLFLVLLILLSPSISFVTSYTYSALDVDSPIVDCVDFHCVPSHLYQQLTFVNPATPGRVDSVLLITSRNRRGLLDTSPKQHEQNTNSNCFLPP